MFIDVFIFLFFLTLKWTKRASKKISAICFFLWHNKNYVDLKNNKVKVFNESYKSGFKLTFHWTLKKCVLNGVACFCFFVFFKENTVSSNFALTYCFQIATASVDLPPPAF